MKYDDYEVRELTIEHETEAYNVLREEFPDHDIPWILKEYEWIVIAITKESNQVVGVATANKYIPRKALLCDIAVDKKHRSYGVGIQLLKALGEILLDKGYTHLLGFTPKNCKEALSTYRRVATIQEEMIVTTSTLDISVPHITQLEDRLRYLEINRKKGKES